MPITNSPPSSRKRTYGLQSIRLNGTSELFRIFYFPPPRLSGTAHLADPTSALPGSITSGSPIRPIQHFPSNRHSIIPLEYRSKECTSACQGNITSGCPGLCIWIQRQANPSSDQESCSYLLKTPPCQAARAGTWMFRCQLARAGQCI